jgi:NAD(P)-dependent dehydrogenase (short-subunit alcohol dehydrogenase family)
MGRLEERVAIVTGAGAGIGRGIARRFAREGARITVAEIDPESGKRTVEEIEALASEAGSGAEALFVRTDVGSKQDVLGMVERTVERWGRVDVLVNNAWSGPAMRRAEWMDDETLQRAFQVGTLGAFQAMQACFPHMKARGYGRVINLCSLNGVNAHMFTIHYNMAKEALRAITRTAAREWADRGITCNVICPAAETEASIELRKVMPELFEKIDPLLPMKRLGDPEADIAPVALFLASEDSQYLTGNTLFADGGSHINGAGWVPELPEEEPG